MWKCCSSVVTCFSNSVVTKKTKQTKDKKVFWGNDAAAWPLVSLIRSWQKDKTDKRQKSFLGKCCSSVATSLSNSVVTKKTKQTKDKKNWGGNVTAAWPLVSQSGCGEQTKQTKSKEDKKVFGEMWKCCSSVATSLSNPVVASSELLPRTQLGASSTTQPQTSSK